MSLLNPLWVALGATFTQQTFATIGKIVVPVIAGVAFPAMGVDAGNVGVFTGFYSLCQVIIVLFCGNLVRRYGGLRMTQIGLFSILIGMTAAASGQLWAFAITAILVSFGVSVSTPASSQILARYSPPKYQPLIFSAKQTAVPVGFMAAGILVPFLEGLYGWQGAFIGIGLMCFGFAFILEPTRRELDQDKDPAYPLSPRNIKGDIALTMRTPGLRLMVFIQGAFVGLQTVYTTYFVLFFMERMDYSLAAAGAMFSTATLIGLPSRMLWGYVASRWLSPYQVMSLLGFVMTGAFVLTAFNSPAWPAWALLVVAVTVICTAAGWQGVALSEVARQAPPGKVGNMTATVISLSCISQIILPPIFAVILLYTGSYTVAFLVVPIPALVVAVICLTADRWAGTAQPVPAAQPPAKPEQDGSRGRAAE